MKRNFRLAIWRRDLLPALAMTLVTTFVSVPASAQSARISKLADFAFGTVANLAVDTTLSESLCAYSTGTSRRYHVTATGSGTGGAFTLAGAGTILPYEVEWNQAAAQTSGTALAAGVALNAQTSTASAQTCTSGPATTASLIVILRATTLSAATADNYSGVLTIILAPN